MTAVHIAIVGDYDASVVAHRANPLALALAAAALNIEVRGDWIGTETLGEERPEALERSDGIWCVPSTPYRSEAGALGAIRFARESGRPFLGTCGGFQHALLEYARNVLGAAGAAHAENHPGADDLVVTPLACELVERSGRVIFDPGSRLALLHGGTQAEEQYHCRYGLSPEYQRRVASGPLVVIARDPEGDVRAMELETHPFFVITLYQPERAGLAGRAHPLITAFVAAAHARRGATG